MRPSRGSIPLLLVVATLRLAPQAASVPIPVEQRLLEPEGRAIGQGELVRILTRWDRGGYQIEPDFRPLDAGAGGLPAVADSGNGSYLVLYRTGDLSGLADRRGIAIPIRAIDPADQSSFTDVSLTLCRNRSTPVPVHLESWIRDGKSLFFPGDSLVVRSVWNREGAAAFRLVADYRSIAPGFIEQAARTVDWRSDGVDPETLEVRYRLPGAGNLTTPGNAIPLTVVGRDTLCSEIRISSLWIDLRTSGPPAPLGGEVASPLDRGVREGDLLQIDSRWDRDGYLIRADFQALDGGTGGSATVVPGDSGLYSIRYVVGTLAGMPDARVTVPITAVNHLGDSFTDVSVGVCRNLRTPAPEHIESRFRSGRTRYHPGDSILVVTRWRSETGIPFTITADLTSLVPGYRTEEALVTSMGGDSFRVAYRLPQRDLVGPDGTDLPIVLVARDELCSTVRHEGLRAELDKTPPPVPPRFDPLPAETDRPVVTVAGVAEGAARVGLLRNDVLRGFLPVDPATERFQTEMELVEGSNRISGWSEDDLGNKTTLGTSQIVRLVSGRRTLYPTPFRPGDEIKVQDRGGMREVLLQIFNLEGIAVAESRRESIAGLEIGVAWDGRDARGDLAQPGYYVVRIRRTAPDGKVHEEVKPLLFRNE